MFNFGKGGFICQFFFSITSSPLSFFGLQNINVDYIQLHVAVVLKRLEKVLKKNMRMCSLLNLNLFPKTNS